MVNSAQASLSEAGWSSGGRDLSPIRYLPFYNSISHVWDSESYFGPTRSSMLPSTGNTSVDLFGPSVHDTAVGALKRRCKR